MTEHEKAYELLTETLAESTLETVETLERAAESLTRLGDLRNAIPLYALALKMRMEATDGP